MTRAYGVRRLSEIIDLAHIWDAVGDALFPGGTGEIVKGSGD